MLPSVNHKSTYQNYIYVTLSLDNHILHIVGENTEQDVVPTVLG